MTLLNARIVELDLTDSTNNYAMHLIDGNKAQHGMTIVAQSQTAGKGQRGKEWVDMPGQSLLMSIILYPGRKIQEQFLFSISIAVAIANVLQKLNNSWKVNIKWPNDIIINDKKAGGVLIENVLRGATWAHSVVGLGLNVLQNTFPEELPYATSLFWASGIEYKVTDILHLIREAIIIEADTRQPDEVLLVKYNAALYKKGQQQVFSDAMNRRWSAKVLDINADGTLNVQLENGEKSCYQHGQYIWVYSEE